MGGSGKAERSRDSAQVTGPVTELLRLARGGDAAAEGALFELVYVELRRRAERAMRRQPRGHTLQPTALVHEVFLKIARKDVAWADRTHFFATAACAMKQILVDHAKGRNRAKRGRAVEGERLRVDDVAVACDDRTYDVTALRDALDELAAIDPRAADVVVMRFLGGMKAADVAERLGVTTKTVGRDWEFARAWLAERLDA
jgi:RNA polymerase sigma factor (TIGR02999 family)